LLDKAKKPKEVEPSKPHGEASAQAFIEAEAAEIAADKAEQSKKVAGNRQKDRPK
jgi:hypothetical protein